MKFWVFIKMFSVNLYKNKSLRYLISLAFYFLIPYFPKEHSIRSWYCFVTLYLFLTRMSLQNMIVVLGITTRITKIIENNLCFLQKIIFYNKLNFENLIFNGFLQSYIEKKKVIKCIKTLFYYYSSTWCFDLKSFYIHERST